MTSDLQSLRREFSEQRIGQEIYTLLGRIVRVTVATYPPQIYSPSGAWDEATLIDLVHDWVEKRLLRGDLEVLLNTAASMGSLRAQLSRSFTQLLINGRRRDVAGNLYKRVLEMLKNETSTFVPVGEASTAHQGWTLVASAQPEPTQLQLGQLVRLAYELSDEDLAVVRYGSQSLKSSPDPGAPALRRFLVHLLQRAEGTLTPTIIAEIMQRRFSLQRQRVVELEEMLNSGDPPVDLHVAANDAARAVLLQLRLTDVEAVRALLAADMVVARAAADLGCSEGRISGARGRLQQLIAQFADSEEEAMEILRIVIESLFQ